MKIIKIPGLISLLIVSVMLCSVGCGKTIDAKETTLYIKKDQSLVGAIVEDWTEEYLDEKELEQQINQEIEDFTQQNSKDSASLEKFEIKEKKAKVDIAYDSIRSYAEFNNVVAYNGAVEQAQKEGYDFSGEFKSAKDKPAVTLEELDGSKEYQALILSEKLKVSLEKEILYYSGNVKVEKDQKTATVDASGGQYAYIIYK